MYFAALQRKWTIHAARDSKYVLHPCFMAIDRPEPGMPPIPAAIKQYTNRTKMKKTHKRILGSQRE